MTYPALATVDTFLDGVWCYDALTLLRSLPANSVHCVVTSPPYFGLRDYSADGQIGLEDTPDRYVARLVEVFEGVRRVLREDGVCWINLGDSYSSGSRKDQVTQTKRAGHTGTNQRPPPGDLAGKQLLGIPWRVAFALQAAGWWLRSASPWIKGNPMPESVQDRHTTAHEYVFMLTKSARYWFDADAVRKEHDFKSGWARQRAKGFDTWDYTRNKSIATGNGKRHEKATFEHPAGRNRRTSDFFFESLDAYIAHLQHVREHGGMLLSEDGAPAAFIVNTTGSPLPHFAMFPQALIEPMILAGCPARVCSECGAGYVRVVEREQIKTSGTGKWGSNGSKWIGEDAQSSGSRIQRNLNALRAAGQDHGNPFPRRITKGFAPSCTCHADADAGIVLDPFMGSGTTALVAQKHGRHWIGCDINPETVQLANERTAYHGDDARMMAEQAAGVRQLALV